MADCNEERRSACSNTVARRVCALLCLAPVPGFAQSQQPLSPPWQATAGTGAATGTTAPPPPPGSAGGSTNGPQNGGQNSAPALGTHGARVEFDSDDAPVEVFVVTGSREVTQLVSVPAAPTSAMMFGPGFPMTTMGPFGTVTPTPFATNELVEARTTVEQRRFLCRTPCSTRIPEGPVSLHLRTLGAAVGTESVAIPREGVRFRVRTASVGLYTIGQATLWVGAGLAITGATLIVQSQTGCGAITCTLWPGVIVTSAGALSMAAGIPLVVMNSRKLEALGLRSVALGLGTLSFRF